MIQDQSIQDKQKQIHSRVLSKAKSRKRNPEFLPLFFFSMHFRPSLNYKEGRTSSGTLANRSLENRRDTGKAALLESVDETIDGPAAPQIITLRSTSNEYLERQNKTQLRARAHNSHLRIIHSKE